MPPLPAKKRKTKIVGFGSTSSGARKVIGWDKKPAKITKKTRKTDTKKTGVHTFGEMIKEGQRKEAGSKAKQDGGDKTDAHDGDYKPDPEDVVEDDDELNLLDPDFSADDLWLLPATEAANGDDVDSEVSDSENDDYHKEKGRPDMEEDEESIGSDIEDDEETFDEDGTLVRTTVDVEKGYKAGKEREKERMKHVKNISSCRTAHSRLEHMIRRVRADNDPLLEGVEPHKETIAKKDHGGYFDLVPDERGSVEMLGPGLYRELKTSSLFTTYERDPNAVGRVAVGNVAVRRISHAVAKSVVQTTRAQR
ncbi:hypothetical protein LTR54_012872 [Friedmanniomyces endolithicus]|nr:hypothetical protein LTS00_009205 [Friedmanniomyces endolithicus]KAK0988164.1 hypothetical protein LTR54_012872 [Friedmanniomyces endolithicus]